MILIISYEVVNNLPYYINSIYNVSSFSTMIYIVSSIIISNDDNLSTYSADFIDEMNIVLYNILKDVILLDLFKDIIRKRIKEKFSTIENFSKHTNIPRTTINFILKNGVSLSNYGMVCKILKELDIYSVNEHPIVIDSELLDFIKIYGSLDDIGKHTVSSVAETEYRRLHPEYLEEAIIAAYGSITSGKPLTEEEKTIMNIVDKIKKDNNEE